MNIRSLSNPAQVLAKDEVEAQKGIKSNETTDREANGQQSREETDSFRSLTDEEIEQVLEKIRSNDGIQKHGLLVHLSEETGQKIVRIETPEGEIVKRFIERDLYYYLLQGQSDDLQLVKRVA